MFCTWVFSWAAVPSICFINEHIFELPSDRLERLTSYVSMMTVTFVMGKLDLFNVLYSVGILIKLLNIFIAYIFVLLWIDMNLLEVKSNTLKQNASMNVPTSNSELVHDIIEPGNIINNKPCLECLSVLLFCLIDNIPDLEEVYEDISITDEFKIDNTLLEFSEAVNESKLLCG